MSSPLPAATPSQTLPAEVSALLAPGETVRWSGQPAPAAYLARGLPAIIYGTTWSVLGAFWYHGSGGIGGDSAFQGWWRLTPLFSLPFILAGFSFFFYPLSLGRQARRTWYVVTDRRVLWAEQSPNRPLRWLDLAPGRTLPLVRRRLDGLHDLILSRRAQAQPHLTPRFEDGFFGLRTPDPALAALAQVGA